MVDMYANQTANSSSPIDLNRNQTFRYSPTPNIADETVKRHSKSQFDLDKSKYEEKYKKIIRLFVSFSSFKYFYVFSE